MSLVVDQLTKVYGEQYAVNNISFEAKEGEILGFLGPNGAGKSTTMKIATCYVAPTSGSVKVSGFDVQKNPIQVRENVGYLPEHNPLYLDMFVHEYLRFAASLHKITGKKAKNRVSETIELVGLTKEQNKPISALSKGYRQRVGLAQALIHDPKVLILDEPTTGLDPNQILEIRNVIKGISQNKTVVFSTHIMQEVQALCNRIVIIREGEIVANKMIEDLGTQEKQLISIEFESALTDFDAFSAIEGFFEITPKEGKNQFIIHSTAERDIRGDVFRLAADKGWVILEMTREKTSLEGIFKELTSK